MCGTGLQSQCETTQVREYGTGASLLGYTKLYGQVPGGQAELLRVPQAHYGPIKVPEGPPDDRFVLLSDVLPTAWQAVQYADVPDGGSLLVLGLGPIGEMACRIAQHLGIEQVIGVDLVPERLARAASHGVQTLDVESLGDDLADQVRELTGGRGPDGGHRRGRHGGARRPDRPPRAPPRRRCCPTRSRSRSSRRPAIDRLSALHAAIDLVPPRRHGLDLRRLRRRDRPDADDPDVRQAAHVPHGAGERRAAGSTTSCRW